MEDPTNPLDQHSDEESESDEDESTEDEDDSSDERHMKEKRQAAIEAANPASHLRKEAKIIKVRDFICFL